MADVQALDMDVVTEKSNHNVVGMAVSVCITPAAPSPLPMPYPLTATVTEGITDSPLRTKVCGTNCATIGSVLKTCHGNEPGTLKEVVSLNQMGPVAPITGAFTVLIELGPAAFTGSQAIMNKAPTPGVGSNASDAGGAGGGGGGAGAGGGAGGGPGGPSGPGGGGGGSGGSASGAAALKGVSQHEADIAAKPGNTKEQIKAREKIAKRFYKQKGLTYDKDPMSPTYGKMRPPTAAEARRDMRGIDFNKPVTVGPPPPLSDKTPLGQWQVPGGRQGQYYAAPGTAPTQLGIHDQGKDSSGAVVPKTSTNYNADPNTPYLQSTAAPVKDTWSVPGSSYGTSGGATQYYVGDKNNMPPAGSGGSGGSGGGGPGGGGSGGSGGTS